jgi:hypothetical protein
MSGSDWQSPMTAAKRETLDAAGFAWEFLLRDPDFRREHRRLSRLHALGTLPVAEAAAFAQRWGARFQAQPARA